MVGVVAAFCVAGSVVKWPWWVLCRIAAVGVFVLCFVSWVLSLHGHSGCRVAWPWWVSLCRVELWSGLLHGRSGCRRTMLCRGHNGCHTMWCCSCSCCTGGVMGIRVGVVRDHSDWTTKEEISRKKRRKKRKMH